MRTLAATLLAIATVLQLILGTLYLLSSAYRPVDPAQAGSTPPAGLTKEQVPGSGRQLTLGVVLLVAGVAGLAGAVTARRRKGPGLALGLAAVALLGPLAVLLLDRAITVALVALVLTLLAALALWLSRLRARAPRSAEADGATP